MLEFFKSDDKIFHAKLEALILTKCLKLQNLVSPFDSFKSVHSFTSSHNPIPQIAIVDLISNLSDNTETDNGNTNLYYLQRKDQVIKYEIPTM